MKCRGRKKMNTLFSLVVTLAIGAALVGCGTAPKAAERGVPSIITGVSSEIKNGGPLLEGYVDVVISAVIKTDPEGHFLFDQRGASEARDGYPFVLTVDGQSAVWKAEGREEDTPEYDSQGKRIPDGGKGTLYHIEKKIRMTDGPHRIQLALPEEGYSTEITVHLPPGLEHVLEFRPLYKKLHKSPEGYIRHFAHGISDYESYLDGSLVQ
jgi:hypothetical protein